EGREHHLHGRSRQISPPESDVPRNQRPERMALQQGRGGCGRHLLGLQRQHSAEQLPGRMMRLLRILAAVTLFVTAAFPPFCSAQAAPPPKMSDARLLEEVQRRAFRFFWEKSDPNTGLTNDRARNRGT